MSRITTLKRGTIEPFLKDVSCLLKAKSSENFEYLAFLVSNDVLSVLELSSSNRKETILTIAIDFEWHLSENDCKLVVLTAEFKLIVYDVKLNDENLFESVASIDYKCIVDKLHENGIDCICDGGNVKLLRYENDIVSVVINGNIIVAFKVESDNSFTLANVFALDCECNEVIIVVVDFFVFCLNVTEGIVDVRRLDNGAKCVTIDVIGCLAADLPDFNFNLGKTLHFAVSRTISHLVIIDQRGRAVCLDLKSYISFITIEHRDEIPFRDNTTSEQCQSSVPSIAMSDDVDTFSLAKMSMVSSIGRCSEDSLKSKLSFGMRSSSFATAASKTPFWFQSQRKHKKIITGFEPLSEETNTTKPVRSKAKCCKFETPELLKVRDLVVNRETVIFWQDGDNSADNGNLIVCNLENASVIASLSFTEPTFVIFGSSWSLPYLLLMSDRIAAISYESSQEDVVSRFMFYENASVADALAKLNGWESISMPLSVLELGLKNHQLDAISFFLNSQEIVYCNCHGPLSTGDWSFECAFIHLENIASLLLTAVKENLLEITSKSFGEQLLQISLNHFNKVLKHTIELKSNCFSDTCVRMRLSQLTMEHLTKFRKYLKNLPEVDSSNTCPLSIDEKEIERQLQWDARDLRICLDNWRNIGEQEVIRDAIWNRCIPLAEWYFETMMPLLSEDQMTFHDRYMTVGFDWIIDCLLHKDLSVATTLLRNLGCNVNEQLHRICFNTANKVLRAFLSKELQQRNVLTTHESDMVRYLNRVEQLYPCQSFEKASELQSTSRIWGESQLKQVEELFVTPFSDKVSDASLPYGEIGFSDNDNCESSGYCCLTLEWTRCWTKEQWERIIMEGLLSKDVDFQIDDEVSPVTAWRYLLSHNDLPRILIWLKKMQIVQNDANSESSFPMITSEFVEEVEKQAVPHVADCVLDELAKIGIFSQKEISNVQLLFSRFVRISSTCSINEIISSSSTITTTGILQSLIQLCLKNDLPNVLYEYMDRFNVANDQLFLDNAEISSLQDTSWFPMMIKFRNWSKNPTDREAIFKACLSNAQYVFKMKEASVEEIFKSGHLVAGLATLLYAPGTLQEALTPPSNKSEIEWKVDESVLMSALEQEPILKSSISQYILNKHDTVNDITLYHLLRDNVPFDTDSLFGWQSTNPFKSPDSFSDLPYFSHPELVKKYGYVQDLDFTYYLKQARPSYAYVKFIIQCVKEVGTVNAREITEACNLAHSIAICQFYNKPVAAGCVAFMEMLNWNTQGLRIDLEVGHMILDHKIHSTVTPTKGEISDSKHEEEIALLLIKAVTGQKGSSFFKEIVNKLEDAILAKCTAEDIPQSSMDAFFLWSLVSLFCRRHNFVQSTVYLKLCAEENDWLLLSLFAEIHKFPKHQVLQVTNQYLSEPLKQHLTNAFGQLRYHSIKSKKTLERKTIRRDIRANLYSRIGVSTSTSKGRSSDKGIEVESEDDACQSETAGTGSSDDVTDQSTTSSLTSYDVANEFSVDDIPSDLLGILLYCNNSPDPWKSLLMSSMKLRNPILSVLAACFKEASILDCLCVWLVTSCHIEGLDVPFLPSSIQFSYDDLSKVINIVMKMQQIPILVEGFYYFQPESPLYDLFRFLKGCIWDKMFEDNAINWQVFQNSLSKIVTNNEHVIGDRQWLEEVSVVVLNESILQTCGNRECIQFLDIIKNQLINTFILEVHVPNYMQILHMLQLLVDVDVNICIQRFLLDRKNPLFSEECEVILNDLLRQKLFDVASNFATIMELNKSPVIIAQMREELIMRQVLQTEGDLQKKLSIWNHCLTVFKENSVDKDLIINFFTEYGLQIQHPWERFYVLHLGWSELKETEGAGVVLNVSDRQTIEREMWLARIGADVRHDSGQSSSYNESVVEWDAYPIKKSSSPGPVKLIVTQTVFESAQNESVPEEYFLQSDAEKVALDKIIGQELDSGNIHTAYRLSQMFEHKCQSLNINMTCMKLAEGTMKLHHLDTSMRILLEKGSMLRPRKLSSRKISLSTMRHSGSSSSFSGDTLPSSTTNVSSNLLTVPSSAHVKLQDDVLDVMEKLVDHCEYGRLCCSRVIIIYSIADVLGMKYIDIVRNMDDVALLKVLLLSDAEDRFFLAKEYILANDVNDTFVANFLCEHIVSALRFITGNKSFEENQLRSSRELILKPNDSASTFTQLVKICKDPSLLGSELLRVAEINKSACDDSLEVELCIRAHSCFTVACHVEGITRSLQNAKKLCRLLTEKSEFSLMVRLLTGIGRFSEMTYIFDILRANHQLELLFRKGMEKVPDLKIALLDYVRRFDPVDTEMLTMISLHFSMYYEIAKMLLSDAKNAISLLNLCNMKEQPKLQESLENIMQLFADASESYLKAECMQQAVYCSKQAQLVALQLFFYNSGVQVLALDSGKVSEFIAKHGKVYEAIIVADAYDRHQDWALALYNNFVVKNDVTYLKDFQDSLTFSSSLCEEIARRYQKSLEKTDKMSVNMKHLLNLVDDIEIKYTLALDLGFDDVIADMMKSDSGSYLKDFIRTRKQW